MLRFFGIFLGFCMLLFSCTSDDCTDGEGEKMEKTPQVIQLTLKLALSGNDDYRFDTYSDRKAVKEENGTVQESRVEDALIVLGSVADGSLLPIVIHNVHEVKGFKPSGNMDQWSGYLEEIPGTYLMIVIANPLPGLKDSDFLQKGVSWYTFLYQSVKLTAPDYIDRQSENVWSENHFMMTNAFNKNVSEYKVELLPENDNVKSISVQRVCARFDYKANKPENVYVFPEGQESYVVKTRTDERITEQSVKVRVQLTEVALTNLSRSFHLLKMFSSDELAYYPTPYGQEMSDNYVVDTDWKEKKNYLSLTGTELGELFYFSSEKSVPGGEMLQYVSLPLATDKYERLFYASENTIPGVNIQINKLSTGVVFKGGFELCDINGEMVPTGTELFFYRVNSVYCFTDNWAIVNSDLNLNMPTAPGNTELAKLGINKYLKDENGKYSVWYTYWNRHNDNFNPYKMGIMEFAVVRNNVYKLNVRSIKTLGNPLEPTGPENPWKPDGNTLDERWPELEVVFEVSEWKNREIIYEI